MAPQHLPLTHDDPVQHGPYRLVARLGSGGMGTVYLARDSGGRAVALKTMHARIADEPDFRTRFRLETDAARVIGGRHGAEVVDADPLAPTPWLATEYVLGPPLDEAVEHCGPLPETSVRALGAALCEALAQLHSSAVVHRDLKPSNILVSASGPKVIDFGIARAIGDDRLTRTGAAAGTPAYMSPEQAGGLEHTAAGDVFALAGVLVHAASGRGPFGGGQAADLLYRVRYGDPGLDGVPEALVPVLHRCLAKDPAARPGMAQLAAELAAGLPGGGREFAEALPDGVLAEIGRRSAEVWRIEPDRLPAPPGGTFGTGGAATAGAAVGYTPTQQAYPASAGTGGDGGRTGLPRRKLLAVAGGSGLALAAAGAGAWAWAGREDGGGGGGTASGASPSRGPGGAPEPVWRAATSFFTDGDLPPLLAGGKLVTSNRAGLVALDARSGEQQWASGESDGNHVMADGERLYEIVPESADGRGLTLRSLDLRTGARAGEAGRLPDFDGREHGDGDRTVQPLAAAGGVVYLAARTREANASKRPLAQGWYLVAFDLRARKERWRRPLKRYATAFTSFGDDVSAYSVKPLRGRLLLTRPRNDYESPVQTVAVWDPRTGEQMWNAEPLPRERDDDAPTLPRQLATDPRHVYFGSGRLTALRLSDGKEAWRHASGDLRSGEGRDEQPALYGPPAVRDGVVFAAEWNHGLIAVGARNGRLLWKQKPGSEPAPDLDVPPVVGRRYVYVSAGDHRCLIAVSRRTHRTAWKFRLSEDGDGGTGEHFVVHRKAKRIIGRGRGGAYAIPLE